MKTKKTIENYDFQWFCYVARSRIELPTSGLWIRRSNQLSYLAVQKECKYNNLFFYITNIFSSFLSQKIYLFDFQFYLNVILSFFKYHSPIYLNSLKSKFPPMN